MIFILMLLRLIGGAAYNSGQRLKNVIQAHLVKASGKLALPKKIPMILLSLVFLDVICYILTQLLTARLPILYQMCKFIT